MHQFWKGLGDRFDRGVQFVMHDVWRLGASEGPIPDGFITKHIRVAFLLVRGLVQDRLLLRASALSFSTLLAVVPFLAVIFSIINAFDLGDVIYREIATWAQQGTQQEAPAGAGEDERLNDQQEATADVDENERLKRDLINWLFQGVAQQETYEGEELNSPVEAIIQLADTGSQQEASAAETLGLSGMAVILAAVLGLMVNVEMAFNSIWGLNVSRSWFRMFTDYLLIMLLLPFLAAFVLGITAAFQSETFAERLGHFQFLLRTVHYVTIWLLFSVLYFVIPNTRVYYRYAFLGGIVAGSLWLLESWLYVKFQIGLANYDVVYSSFAQFPMLLMWVYFGWVIMLLGAELTYAYQNEKTFAMERMAEGASFAYREAVALRTMLAVVSRFDRGMPPFEISQAAEQWRVPSRIIIDVLGKLEDANVVRACATEPVTYQPAKDTASITVAEVIMAVRESGVDPSPLRQQEEFEPLLAEMYGVSIGVMSESLKSLIGRVDLDAKPSEDSGGAETAGAVRS